MHRWWKVLVAVLCIVVFAATWRLVQEAGYRRALSRYQRDLQAGTTRAVVDSYLNSHRGKQGVVADGNTWSYLVRIGIEPVPFNVPCITHKVYIALDFDSPGQQGIEPPPGSSSDVLKGIRIKTVGDCL